MRGNGKGLLALPNVSAALARGRSGLLRLLAGPALGGKDLEQAADGILEDAIGNVIVKDPDGDTVQLHPRFIRKTGTQAVGYHINQVDLSSSGNAEEVALSKRILCGLVTLPAGYDVSDLALTFSINDGGGQRWPVRRNDFEVEKLTSLGAPWKVFFSWTGLAGAVLYLWTSDDVIVRSGHGGMNGGGWPTVPQTQGTAFASGSNLPLMAGAIDHEGNVQVFQVRPSSNGDIGLLVTQNERLNVAQGAASVTTDPTVIRGQSGADVSPRTLLIQNLGAEVCRIGNVNVSTSSGVQLVPATATADNIRRLENWEGALYGIVASGSTTIAYTLIEK